MQVTVHWKLLPDSEERLRKAFEIILKAPNFKMTNVDSYKNP